MILGVKQGFQGLDFQNLVPLRSLMYVYLDIDELLRNNEQSSAEK